MPDALRRLTSSLQDAIGLEVECVEEGQFLVGAVPPSQVVRLLTILQGRQDFRFVYLTDVIVVDSPENEERFELNYFVTSLLLKSRLCIQTRVEEDEVVESVTPLYPAAAWFEREMQELFGIPIRTFPIMPPLWHTHFGRNVCLPEV